MNYNKHRNSSSIRLPSYLKIFNFSLLFSALYVIFNWIYVSLYNIIPNNILIFITSPFSALEDFSSYYGNFLVGFSLNFLPVFIMLAIMSYMYTKRNKLNRFLKPSDIFCIGILSSYLTSAIYWFTFKIPSRGTSIIAITLLIYFLIYVITFDFRGLFTKKANKKYSKEVRNRAAYLMLFLLIMIILLTLVSYYSFVLLVHLIGLIISFALIAFLVLWREHYRFLLKNLRIYD